MDFLLQIQEFVEGPIGDLLVQLRTGGIQFPELPALPNISLTPQLTLPENIEVGDLGSTFGDFSPADMSSGDNGSSQLSSGDNGSSDFLSELSSGDNQLSTDFLGDFSELSSGDNGSTDLADLSQLSGENGSSDILDLDLSDLLDLNGELNLPDIPQSV